MSTSSTPRGKVQLKRIEEKSRRQVSFSKRRSGLIKKAKELSVLCDVEIAMIIFSDRGKLYEFCSADNPKIILERYRLRKNEELSICKSVREDKKHHTGYNNYHTGSNLLQMVQRQLEGKSIEQLSLSQLIQLENILASLLGQIGIEKANQLREEINHAEEKKLTTEPSVVDLDLNDPATVSCVHPLPREMLHFF